MNWVVGGGGGPWQVASVSGLIINERPLSELNFSFRTGEAHGSALGDELWGGQRALPETLD